MKLTVKNLQEYLFHLYGNKANDQGLFMKLVEEIGETAEVLNMRTGRKKENGEDINEQLANELADIIHYTVAIAAINNIDLE
ncbi:MAG: nucleotide pyrophosphohydrolase, partial [Erysipelotrichales bacterium]|nr:nucleotide pyrophosphohydrolase [Erysipelotrichales bacterium]